LNATAQPTATPAKPDFFISYTHKDLAWAEWIAWQLEEAHFTTVLQAWDFHPGGNFVLKMQEEMALASRMIAVLSPNYLESVFTAPEWAGFFALDPTGRDEKLVPVRVLPCHPTGLLSQIIYIDLVDLDREVAKNTLLNGIRLGRAKPASSPAFPGHAEPVASLPDLAVDAAPRRQEVSFPGPTNAPLEAGSTTFSLEYSVDIPEEIAGAEPAFILLTFTLIGEKNQITLEFEQDAFEIYNESRPGAGLERNRFQFDYPHPGKFHEKLKICAKDKFGNNRISVTCSDVSGKRWGQNTKNVRVSKAPNIWESARFLLTLLLRPIRRRPISAAVVSLVLLAGWAVYWSRHTTPDNLRKVVLNCLDWRRPTDYFGSRAALTINWDFNTREEVDANWHGSQAGWHQLRPPRKGELSIGNGGYAILYKPSLYDFDASFVVKLPPGVPLSQEPTVTLALRVWPQDRESDILRSRGYRFTLSAPRRNGNDPGLVRLNGFKCKHLGDGDRDCQELNPVADMSRKSCPDDAPFQVDVRGEGSTFNFKIWVRSKDREACPPEIGSALFKDEKRWPVPFSYGGIAFLNAQTVWHIDAQQLNPERHSDPEAKQ